MKSCRKSGKENANKFANNFVNIIAVVATLISVIGVLFAPMFVKIFAGGFDEQTHILTTELVRITFPMIIFTALAFSFIGLLQSYGEFNVPAGTSAISNLFVILFLLLFSNKTGIHGVCYAIVIAWALQFLIQIPFAKKFGYSFKFSINFKDENIKKVFKLAIPILISTAVIPINSLVSMSFASGKGDGAVSALEYSYKLYIVIYGIFSYAIGNVIFPELSRANSSEDKTEYINTLKNAIKMIAYLLIPLTVGIMIYSEDIVRLLYERGEFTATSTLLTADALKYYAIGIIGAGIVEIMNKAFYAKQDTKTPLIVGIIIVISNFILCYVLGNTKLAYLGLALSTAVCAILNAIILSLSMNHKSKGIFNKEVAIYLLKTIISSAAMLFVILFANKMLVSANIIIRVILGVGLGSITYVLLTFLFGTLTKKRRWNILIPPFFIILLIFI